MRVAGFTSNFNEVPRKTIDELNHLMAEHSMLTRNKGGAIVLKVTA
jgi:hypothetical protein